MTALYRVRRGLFGTSVLQKLYAIPSPYEMLSSPSTHYCWKDVPFNEAPASLVVSECTELKSDGLEKV